MKHILLLATGGTIASEYDPVQKRVVTKISGEELVRRLGDAVKDVKLTVPKLNLMPSCHFTPSIILEWTRLVKKELAAGHYDGVVVTQGTDTLEESAFLFDLLVDLDVPVVFTGAMKAHHQLYSDAYGNLAAAILTACREEAAKYGVLVVMNGEIHSAQDVRKLDSESISAFVSPKTGIVGRVFEQQVVFYREPFKTPTFGVESFHKKVDLVYVTMGMDGSIVDFYLDRQTSGLVVAGFGAGNIPPALVGPLKKAVERNIPVLMTSRADSGPALALYDYEGGGYQLEQMGILFSSRWSFLKGRLLLLCMVNSGMDLGQIRDFFHKNEKG